MEVKKRVDVPMSAMWTQIPGVTKEQYGYNADDRESASVAHVYGQNLAAAESLTTGSSPWAWSPATLKPTADQEFLNGINRFVIHESAHQPLIDKAPGLTLGPFGQWFNRNETWAEQAGAWMDYLARTSYLLQQGHFAADVIYFYGEDSNLTALFNSRAPDIPEGFGFDYINADGLIHELSATYGAIRTGSGMNYRLLALDPNSKHMSLPVLRAIYSLVEQGAVVAGHKPVDTPSLADDAVEFKRLNDKLFGDGTGAHSVGKGKVYAGSSVESALKALGVTPDFDHTKPGSNTRILFVHRKLSGSDVYFLDNRSDRDQTVDASFRVTEKSQSCGTPRAERSNQRRTTLLTVGPGFHCISSHGALYLSYFANPQREHHSLFPKKKRFNWQHLMVRGVSDFNQDAVPLQSSRWISSPPGLTAKTKGSNTSLELAHTLKRFRLQQTGSSRMREFGLIWGR